MIYLLLKYYGHTFRSLALFATCSRGRCAKRLHNEHFHNLMQESGGLAANDLPTSHLFPFFSSKCVCFLNHPLSLLACVCVTTKQQHFFTTIVDAADGEDDHTRHTSHALLQITRTHVRTLSIVRYLLDDNKYANTKHSHALWVFLYRKAHLQNEHLAHSI